MSTSIKEKLITASINVLITTFGSMLILSLTYRHEFNDNIQTKIDSKVDKIEYNDNKKTIQTQIDSKVSRTEYNDLRELLLYNIKQVDELKKFEMEQKRYK